MMGADVKTKDIGNIQNVVCPCCESLTSLHVIKAYSFFHIFLIPLVKWNKKYFATARCCRKVYALCPDKGEALEREGRVDGLDAGDLKPCDGAYQQLCRCAVCNKPLNGGYAYCPYCGARL